MSNSLRIALAQINPVVGDLSGNLAKIQHYVRLAGDQQADLVVFPELAITGYPPEDLLLRDGFLQQVAACVQELLPLSADIDIVLGYPREYRQQLFNSAVCLSQGQQSVVYDKCILPNYGVFDEKRYFTPGSAAAIFHCCGIATAITVCEDIWQPQPAQDAVAAGAQCILNLNASPFHRGKAEQRRQVAQARCEETQLPMVYVNMVGGQDELVFDGGSMVLDRDGRLIHQAAQFVEQLTTVQLTVVESKTQVTSNSPNTALLDETAAVYQALVLALRDYVQKNGFSGVILGLSGGVDSALTLAIAVDALGAEQVQAVMLPSQYTSTMSLEDAAAMAAAFNVEYSEIPIEPVFQAALQVLDSAIIGADVELMRQNLQARSRGMLLMALANSQRKLVLATGNKSELAVGYATLYGDMAGGFAPLKDVSKTWVYRLCEYRNQQGLQAIPQRILQRPPSAELAPEQQDTDSLPPYAELDPILERYLEQEQSIASIINAGFAPTMVQDVVRQVNRSEYKRRQAAPGPKVTPRAFGRERRYPIVCAYDLQP